MSANDFAWMTPNVEPEQMIDFGIRLSGGGTHQSKTMMLKELGVILATGLSCGADLKEAVISDNVLAKSTCTNNLCNGLSKGSNDDQPAYPLSSDSAL